MAGADGDTGMIMRIFAFYATIFVLLGLIGGTYVASQDIETPDAPNATGFFSSISSVLSVIGYFFSGIGFTITNIPWWLNILLFAPLSITLLYIGIKLVIDGIGSIIP